VLWMVGLYVRPEWRGRGMGKRLLGEIHWKPRAILCSGLVLTVDMANVWRLLPCIVARAFSCFAKCRDIRSWGR
jgi:GNAT superfamily N-acetyltransferase